MEQPSEAAVLLIAPYYVMGCKWPSLTRMSLIFLTAVLFGVSKVALEVARNVKLVDLLKELGLYS